jgi:hypothetical protein
MADKKISDLALLSAADLDAAVDYLPIVDPSEAAAADQNKRILVNSILTKAVDDGTILDQSYIGSAPEQTPLNQLLGSLAYYDRLPAISFANVAPTVASATSIIIQSPVTFVSGTTAIETIAAPDLTATGGAQITLIPTGIFTTTTAGNIALATTAVVSRALTLTYDSATAKWYPSY